MQIIKSSVVNIRLDVDYWTIESPRLVERGKRSDRVVVRCQGHVNYNTFQYFVGYIVRSIHLTAAAGNALKQSDVCQKDIPENM